MSLIPVKNIYTDYKNNLYNPDDGHDSETPGDNLNWLAIQKAFKSVEGTVDELTTAISDLTDRVAALEGNNK